MLSSGGDAATMLTVLQQAWEKFSLLELPEDHFRKVQVRTIMTDLEKSLCLTALVDKEHEDKEISAASDPPARVHCMCIICDDQPRDVILQCGHVVSCLACTERLINCPICRTAITEIRQAFIS